MMKWNRMMMLVLLFLYPFILSSCSKLPVNQIITTQDKMSSESQEVINNLEKQVRALEAENTTLLKENTVLKTANTTDKNKIKTLQEEIGRISNNNSNNGMLEYNNQLYREEIKKNWQEIKWLRNHSPSIFNMYNPYTLKKDEVIAGLTVEESTPHFYGNELLSYNIKFKGEFTVNGKLKAADLMKGYFFVVADGLESMPYQIKHLTDPISFYIGEPEEIKAKELKAEDVFTATFMDYHVQSIMAKPTVDTAKLVKIVDHK